MKTGALMLAYNCLELSKRTIASIVTQDQPCELLVVNNASTDGTADWLEKQNLRVIDSSENLGITRGWNLGLRTLFAEGCNAVLVVNNDVFLPPWFVSELLSYDVPLVSGIETGKMADLVRIPPVPLVPYPDFSAYLITKYAWDRVGMFDEQLFNYCSDCSYHIRARRMGIEFWKAVVRYYHERSSTINTASPEEQVKMHRRADQDREIFKSMYGCLPGTPEYLSLVFPDGEPVAPRVILS